MFRGQDTKLNRKYPGWKEARKVLEKHFDVANERKRALIILRVFAETLTTNRIEPKLNSLGILKSLEFAKSIEHLERICSIMERIASQLGPEPWNIATGKLNFYKDVERASDLNKEQGGFQVKYIYTPPSEYSYTTTEWVDYGGSGTNAYYREEHEVVKTTYVPAQLAFEILPPSKDGDVIS